MDLATGELTILGRIASASNTTLLCELGGPDGERVVYKPVRGEVPLWDFPDGTLAGREVASYRVARALGWDLIPETVLRDGPLGQGMVQRWIDEPETDEPGLDFVELFPIDEVPSDYRSVFSGYVEDPDTSEGYREVALGHAASAELERLAVLDVLLNNADRKGGHILTAGDGTVRGVDHGICLHAEPKLRTVLWGWAGEKIPRDMIADVETFIDSPPDLSGLITTAESEALLDRARDLTRTGTMPLPSPHRPIPWPPF